MENSLGNNGTGSSSLFIGLIISVLTALYVKWLLDCRRLMKKLKDIPTLPSIPILGISLSMLGDRERKSLICV